MSNLIKDQHSGRCRSEVGLVGDQSLQETGSREQGLTACGEGLGLVPSVLRSHRGFEQESEMIDFTYVSCMGHETWG